MIKLDKRKCREFIIPGRKMSPESGIFHAQQIDYIVTTAVKVVARHRTLILYVYPRRESVQGDCEPRYTVFHTKDDFLTLSRRADGSTVWRRAAFDRLGSSYCNFSSRCAFYSFKDEKRVTDYFKLKKEGFCALISAQDTIQEKRRERRQREKEAYIASQMAGVRALPRGLGNWIKSVMPAYFFYDYQRKKEILGVCSCCGREILLSGIKQGSKTVCPQCGHELTAKPRSRRGGNMHDRDTFEVIQNTGDGGLVVRIIKAYYSYTTDIPKVMIYENARQFIRQNADGSLTIEHYYLNHKYDSSKWEKGIRPRFSYYQYSFEGDTCGYLYTKNLQAAFLGTPWQYCTIADFYNHFQEEPMEALPFLAAHIKHPRLEHLSKVGFYNLVSDLSYRNDSGNLDETQNRTHKILGIAAEDVKFLCDLDADLSGLKMFRRCNGIKNRQRLFRWQIKQSVDRDTIEILRYMTVHKFIRYAERQYEFLRLRQTPQGTQRYKCMQNMVSEYRDYLEICNKLGYDMKSSFILYPKDLQKSHDRVFKHLKRKKDAWTKREFVAVYKDMSEQLCFEKDGLKIVSPAVPDDIIAEGNSLHHCVGGYIDRVAKRECIIVFLRQCFDETIPYYTIEVRGQKVVQVRGMGNCAMTPEIQNFITAWEKNVLCRLDQAA